MEIPEDLQQNFQQAPQQVPQQAAQARKIRLPKYKPLNLPGLFDFTQKKLDIRHNSKFMNPHYVNDLMLSQPKYQGWTFTENEDLDGDNIPDSVIRDPTGIPVYFNGYYNIDNDNTLRKKTYYHDQKYAANNWDNETYKEYGKTRYEIILIRATKEFRGNFKKALKQQNLEQETIKKYMEHIDGDFVKKFINKYITIPVLFRTGALKVVRYANAKGQPAIDHAVDLNAYAQLLQQSINVKDINITPLMAIYKTAKKIVENAKPTTLDALEQLIKQIMLNSALAKYLYNDFTANYNAGTNKYPKASRINFGLTSVRDIVLPALAQAQGQAQRH